jgi:hypothetical protein
VWGPGREVGGGGGGEHANNNRRGHEAAVAGNTNNELVLCRETYSSARSVLVLRLGAADVQSACCTTHRGWGLGRGG